MDKNITKAVAAKAAARNTSMVNINRRRSTLSVITPAGSANKNHGMRKVTGISAMKIGSRVSKDAIHAQTTTAIPSARLAKPLAIMNRFNLDRVDWTVIFNSWIENRQSTKHTGST